ncbi:alpha/beta hydrolase [Shewanella khirikhana]|uniref:Alpha/beta hydrolase family protein n=1 Tax=Shewanella khirikhana TaxID=1965282 RepID=A0ABM7D1V8_9GAMM|nr:alpha/beta fold hydrolase [Shewanella khirikhana]AZQ10332.1 Alpha/beta hydrolase family protein [Shewanella khirikhana]
MKTLLIKTSKHLVIAMVYATLGVVVTALGFGIWFLNSRADLAPWHTKVLENRFTQHSPDANFADYLAREARLKAEIAEGFAGAVPDAGSPVNRYVRGSLSDPSHWQQDWNWSYEWPNPRANYGVLFIHGMSDSPYALSNLAADFKASAHVLGLRLPGHGTLPSGLVSLEWQDMSAAVALAIGHLKTELGDKPLYIVGFSTGAALALHHELKRIEAGKAPDSRAMVFLSPAIGLAPVARGAYWQARLGEWLRLEKLAWNALGIEYDPFKYVSFAVNAGDVVYRLAEENQRQLLSLSPSQKAALPTVLTFQSMADDTVSSRAVVESLYLNLAESRHQLVLYDVNRSPINQRLTLWDPKLELEPLYSSPAMQATVGVVQNQTLEDGSHPLAVEFKPVVPDGDATALGRSWPMNVYSLSHVALPFSKSDSLYGPGLVPHKDRIQIGAAASRGERGIFAVSADEMLRQKWNPFYAFQLHTIKELFYAPQLQPELQRPQLQQPQLQQGVTDAAL